MTEETNAMSVAEFVKKNKDEDSFASLSEDVVCLAHDKLSSFLEGAIENAIDCVIQELESDISYQIEEHLEYTINLHPMIGELITAITLYLSDTIVVDVPEPHVPTIERMLEAFANKQIEIEKDELEAKQIEAGIIVSDDYIELGLA